MSPTPPAVAPSAPTAPTDKEHLPTTDFNPNVTPHRAKIVATPHQIITPEEAEESCGTIGATNLLATINKLTNQSLRMEDPPVKHAIDWCLEQNLDFGGAYGRLRQLWATGDVGKAWEAVDAEKQSIEQVRSSAFFTDKHNHRTLKHPYVLGPRRIWDLYSHRVIPSHFVPDRRNVWAITHSHREVKVRVLSPVNDRQWPVALPPTVTLENIRNELLGMGAVYCWLDVACARQRGDPKDVATTAIRDEEMAVDLPTMGNIYAMASTVVRYYSGVGLPFSPDGLNDERHWFNRAWTLQEMNIKTVVGGLYTENRPVPITGFESDREAEPFPEFSALLRPLESIITYTPRLAKVVEAMKPRRSQEEVDKIYGLGYLIKARTLPAYHSVPNDDLRKVEDTWWQLVYCMSDTMHGELLFLFPQPGKSKKNRWLPKWAQLMAVDMVQDPHIDESVKLISGGRAQYDGYRLAKCDIAENEVTVMEWEEGRKFHFQPDKTCVLNGTYTLVGNPRRNYFVVCKPQLTANDALEKVFVITVSAEETAKLLKWGLCRSICIFR